MRQFRPGDRQSVEDVSAIRVIVKASDRTVVLVRRGGGALGSDQPVAVLDEVGVGIDRCAGISIGAINSAFIAGHPPEHGMQKRRGFWGRVDLSGAFGSPSRNLPDGQECEKVILFSN